MPDTLVSSLLPVVPYLKIPKDAEPYLEGLKCNHCGSIFTDKRIHCACCYSRNSLAPYTLSYTGKIHAFTVVERSFPKIKVPYVSVVVDMDGGGTIKGNLINVEPDPKKIQCGMQVEVIFEQAPYGDKEGNQYLIYLFQPVGH